MKIKKYYILYKTIRNENEDIEDIKQLAELTSYNDIVNWTGIDRHNVKRMINNNINNWKTLKTFKDYTIIVEKDVI